MIEREAEIKTLTTSSRGLLQMILLVFFLIPFPQKISSIAVGVFIAWSLIELARTRHFVNFRPYWFLPVLFCYYFFSVLLTGGTWSAIEKRLFLVFVPLAFALLPDLILQQRRTKIHLAYIMGNVVVVITLLVRAAFRSTVCADGHCTFSPLANPQSKFDFMTASVMDGNFFFGSEFSWFYDPPYTGLFLVVALYLVFERTKGTQNRSVLIPSIAVYFLFLAALFLLSSKAAMIASLAVTLYIVVYAVVKRTISVPLRAAAVVAMVLVGGTFFFLNPRIKIFRETFWKGLAINPQARFGHDLRILSWDASLDVIRAHWLLGVGEGKKEEALIAMYATKGYVVPAEGKFNSHNQYLDFLLGGGLVGLGLFMAGMIALGIRSVKEKNAPLMAFALIFLFNAAVENLLSRYAGILLFAVFTSFFLAIRNRSENNPT
jgi:O-antigen ligase